jgi:hypothetical protein
LLKPFLSSTFLDLVEEREAVLEALRKKRASTLAMEDFLATPNTPIETALKNLGDSDVMILVIGFRAGTLLPGASGHTYTSAEYEELLRLGKEPLVFVKQERGTHHPHCGAMRNKILRRGRLWTSSKHVFAKDGLRTISQHPRALRSP